MVFGTILEMLYAILLTFTRIWLLMVASIGLALFLGILSARVKIAGAIIIPITDVLEAVPVVSFFPIILVFFIVRVGGPIGVELAVDFLIITALIWNLILGVYQAVSHIPKENIDMAKVYHLTLGSRLRYLYLPSSYHQIVANIMPSFASALFYITLSEVIPIGTKIYGVFGVGSLAFKFAADSQFSDIGILIILLILAIGLNYYLIINPLIKASKKYVFDVTIKPPEEQKRQRDPFINAIGGRITQVVSARLTAVNSLNFARKTANNKNSRRRHKISDTWLNIISGVILLSFTGIAIYLVAISGFAAAFDQYLTNAEFIFRLFVAAAYDLFRIVIVFIVSLLTMVPLALYSARKGGSGRALTGIFQVIYSIPAPILLPLIIEYITPAMSSVLGFGLAFNFDVLLVTFLSAAAYLYFNVYGSALSIPYELKAVAHTFRITGLKRFRYLSLPGVVPGLITGSMAAFGSYWGGLQVSEYVSIGNHVYSVGNGLMMLINKYLDEGDLLRVDAIDIFMVIIIVALSFLLWMRLYKYSQKRFTF
ncbi:MAG: ABC transporter permease subunit [Thermoplasmataceae archaeon]